MCFSKSSVSWLCPECDVSANLPSGLVYPMINKEISDESGLGAHQHENIAIQLLCTLYTIMNDHNL
jgi:hypothetical protein